jgi:hypothetical protein
VRVFLLQSSQSHRRSIARRCPIMVLHDKQEDDHHHTQTNTEKEDGIESCIQGGDIRVFSHRVHPSFGKCDDGEGRAIEEERCHCDHHRAAGNRSRFLLAGYLPATGCPSTHKIRERPVLPACYFRFLCIRRSPPIIPHTAIHAGSGRESL